MILKIILHMMVDNSRLWSKKNYKEPRTIKSLYEKSFSSPPKAKVSSLWHLGASRAEPWIRDG